MFGTKNKNEMSIKAYLNYSGGTR